MTGLASGHRQKMAVMDAYRKSFCRRPHYRTLMLDCKCGFKKEPGLLQSRSFDLNLERICGATLRRQSHLDGASTGKAARESRVDLIQPGESALRARINHLDRLAADEQTHLAREMSEAGAEE